jgi:hypothetical protein
VVSNVTENLITIYVDPGFKDDTVMITKSTLNIDNTITNDKWNSVRIKSANWKDGLKDGPPSNEKTGERSDEFRSIDSDNALDWWARNKSKIMSNKSIEELKDAKHMKSAEQRHWISYAHKFLEIFRAFVGSLSEGDREKYSQRPPIIVMGKNHGTSRMKYLSQFFTVVGIDEYMTSQTCPCCLRKNKEVTGNLRLRECAGECKFQRKGPEEPKKLRVNKDVAACFNLQAIFLQMIANGSRRQEFKKNQ